MSASDYGTWPTERLQARMRMLLGKADRLRRGQLAMTPEKAERWRRDADEVAAELLRRAGEGRR